MTDTIVKTSFQDSTGDIKVVVFEDFFSDELAIDFAFMVNSHIKGVRLTTVTDLQQNEILLTLEGGE